MNRSRVEGPLIVNAEELDVWLLGFFSRLESYTLGAGTSEATERFMGALHSVVSECLPHNIVYTITTNFDSAVGAAHVCNVSVKDGGMCYDMALAALELGL